MTELSRSEYHVQYAKENLKRVPLDLRKEDYDKLKAAAGSSVNGYIKTAINEKLEKDGHSFRIK